MPQLVIRGIAASRIQPIAEALVARMAAICSCGTDNFTIDVVQTTAVYGGLADGTSYPFIEVGWFDRGTTVRDQLATAITNAVREIGIHDVEVVFRVYAPAAYYVNGEPCGTEEEAVNEQLRAEVTKLRRVLQSNARDAMSTRLKDALRE